MREHEPEQEIKECKVNPIYFVEKHWCIKSNNSDTEYKKLNVTRVQKNIMKNIEKEIIKNIEKWN